ncbi:hypothetical protein QJS10_CPB13g01262 [Acorus calamus]|uniref:Late embryogenesis abundant protein LEA-2 subgroup domain-containing protein n=1 Tax=Acorus calamus TaxID=4465 RepID=A0AAV9DG12_ACOCL|nr:hypothetical protein QJS10_CPB13g01265 [Acorus calamus]KAK1300046.1 hypothetical protein QJS10_CPB13g01262 [Acorus calamus]
MHHSKTDSEVTSLAPSSPTRSPPPRHHHRPVYYVQSPSRDSHDGEKTTITATSVTTPAALSPMASPPHSHSSLGRHSRESSASRFSGSLKPTHKKGGGGGGGGGGLKPWKERAAVIEEEGLLEEEEERRGLPRRCYYLAFVVGFFVLFSFFSLILWGASRSQRPQISMKSITFENFVIQAGTDSTGVPTEMVVMNSTVKLAFRNTATFFGVHVKSTPISLSYSELTLASGDMKSFYQSRKSQRILNVVVVGNKVPLYGGGTGLTISQGGSTSTKTNNVSVPLSLNFTVRSRAYVLGKLVKPKFNINIQCSVAFVQTNLNKPISLAKSCQYN